MKISRILLLAIFMAFFTLTAFAQEAQLIDETVARVNSDIITRSTFVKAQETYKEELKQKYQGDTKKVDEEFNHNVGTVLDLIIEDRLVSQRAAELSIDVEAEVNQGILKVAHQTNPNWGLVEFEKALKENGFEIDDIRRSLRTDLQRQQLIRREVMEPIYSKLKTDEKKDWYNQHQQYFQVPGEIKLSEIFITFEGRSEAEAAAIAKQVVAEARAGKPFLDLNKLYSDPKRKSTEKGGELPLFKEDEIIDYLKKAVDKMKAGDISDPIRTDKGLQIIRLNEIKPTSLINFNEVEAQIAQQMTIERGTPKINDYIKGLRDKAYIRVAEAYKTKKAE